MRFAVPLLALALAGCLSPAPAAESVAPAGTPDAMPEDAAPGGDWSSGTPPVVVSEYNGTYNAGAFMGPICITTCVGGGFHPLDTGGNVTAIVAELSWEGPMDLDLILAPEGSGLSESGLPTREAFRDEDGLPGQPDSIARVDVTDPAEFEAGAAWDAIVVSKGAANVPYVLRVTVFRDAPPPDGYTAFGDAGGRVA